MSIDGGFPAEKGFFRQADGSGGGGGGGGKDDETNAKENNEQESSADVLSQLRNNLKEIDKLIEDYDPKLAIDLVKSSRELAKNYQPSSENEKSISLRFMNT